MNFPLQAFQAVSAANPWTYVIFGLIGFGFGYVLESSGFGNSKKLAAQFYFKDMTVLKVMFTAIVVAMVGIFLASALGLLDVNLIWVNPTYLASGIVGGLIMGVGFIVGGFCPGTSVAAAATFKIDGIFFLLGGLFGAFLFGETEQYFDSWYNTAGYYGRLMIPDALHLPTGVVVVLLVLMALFMFWGAEQLERLFGKRDLAKEPRLRIYAGVALLVLALAVAFIGQPTLAEKYAKVAPVKDAALAAREVQVSPAEVYKTVYTGSLNPILLDVRDEADYNLYHIDGAQNVPLDSLAARIPELLAQPAANTVVVLMSNDETLATQAWKTLVASGVANAYILEGGLNNWIAFFGADDPSIKPLASAADEQLDYAFPAALGSRYESCDPDPIEYAELEYVPKIKLQSKRDKSGGGCG
jgi:rhodanese-related sulfurtransferase